MRRLSVAMTGVSPECVGMKATIKTEWGQLTGTVIECEPIPPTDYDTFAASIGHPVPPRHWVTVMEP